MEIGRFICFEGMDGAGKTTAAAGLAKALEINGERIDFLARKDPRCDDPRLTQHLESLAELIWGYGDTPVERMGDHHALYNVASWLSAIDMLKIQPTLSKARSVVMDGWYYKFLARMTLKSELDTKQAATSFSHLTTPDQVFLLDVDPKIAALRKADFTRGETGNFDDFGEPNSNSFVRYQMLVRELLLGYADRYGWTVINVDNRSPEDVVHVCMATSNLRLHTEIIQYE